MTIASFLSMGGHGAYIWPAYAVFFLVLGADYVTPKLRRRRIVRELSTLISRQTRRQAQHQRRHES